MKSLANLIEENLYNTDKNGIHSYVDYFYEKEFLKYRNKPTTIVEVGVFYGGSIRLWHSYFEQPTIFALDIQVYNEHFKSFCEVNDIEYIVGNSYEKQISDMISNFDIFIDDGPHSLESQMKAIELYLPKLNDGGVFIIEDVQEEKHLRILKNYSQSLYTGYSYEFVDIRCAKNRYDDLMLIIRK